MAFNPTDGSDAEKPDENPDDPTKNPPPSLGDVAAFSAAQHDDTTPEAQAAAAASTPPETPPPAAPVQRTGAEIIVDVFSALASRADPTDIDAIRDLVNEPGNDGKPRVRVANGPIQAALNLLCDGHKVAVTRPGNKVLLYELTSQTRAELESPAVIHAARAAVVYLLAKKLLYQTFGHGGPVQVAALTASAVATGLVTGSMRGKDADVARAKGEAPTLPTDAPYAVRQGLSSDPEEDEGEITVRVMEHITRLIDAKMAEQLAPTASSGKDRFQLTAAGEALLYEAGIGAVVDTTFPPKPPRPTLEDLTKEAEAAAEHVIKQCQAEAALMKKHFEEQHARAEREKVLRLGYEEWFRERKIEEPEAILRRRSKSLKDRKIDTFEEEVQLTQEEHDRVIDEHASLAFYLEQSQEEWAAAKSAQKAKEEMLTLKLEALMEVIRKKGKGVYLVSKQAYREVIDRKVVVFSAEPHEIGRIIGCEELPLGAQVTMPGTNGPRWTPEASGAAGAMPPEVKAAADTMIAGLGGDASTPAAKEAIEKFIADMATKGWKVNAGPNEKGVPTFTCTAAASESPAAGSTAPVETKAEEKPDAKKEPLLAADVEPSIAALRGPLEAFFLENKKGVLADHAQERFFDRLGKGKPKAAVVAMFVKVLGASIKAKVINQGTDAEGRQIYWHRDNEDPSKAPDAKAPSKGTTEKSKPAAPPKKKGRPGKG